MTDIAESNLDNLTETDIERGVQAARLIWHDAADTEQIADPRTPAFARTVIDELAAFLASVNHQVGERCGGNSGNARS
jgi:hypothetical protein